jgi:hypothetical protein
MASKLFEITETSPAAPGTVVGKVLPNLSVYEFFRIDAALIGGSGGTLDVYLQRKLKDNVWADWLHYTQIAAGGAAVKWTSLAGNPNLSTALTSTFGIGTDSAPGVALAANTFLGGHPGQAIRAVYVAGSGTNTGVPVQIYLTCWKA